MRIGLTDVCKSFGALRVMDHLNLNITPGGITCLLGPSGCGKTTVLNLLAGILLPDSGVVETGGAPVSVVFQEPRLLPWVSAAENIMIVLRGKMPESAARTRAREILGMLELEQYSDFLPGKLSGGMAQRVSIGRAMAVDAGLLLMDEPFKGLDTRLKAQVMMDVRRLWKASPRTVVMVTHDPGEAEFLAHEILRLEGQPLRVTGREIKAVK